MTRQENHSSDDFASCASQESDGGAIETPNSDPCPFPQSEVEARIEQENIQFEDLAKLRNYFDLEHWTDSFETVSPGGIGIKQYMKGGLFGFNEYLTVIDMPKVDAERYWVSQADLDYQSKSSSLVTESKVFWTGLHKGSRRHTQFQNYDYGFMGASRQYLLQVDTLPRQKFEDFPRLCYCKSVIGITNAEGDIVEEMQKYSLQASYSIWVCWDDEDGMHIMSWIGEDPGWFSAIIPKIQAHLVPGSMDSGWKKNPQEKFQVLR